METALSVQDCNDVSAVQAWSGVVAYFRKTWRGYKWGSEWNGKQVKFAQQHPAKQTERHSAAIKMSSLTCGIGIRRLQWKSMWLNHTFIHYHVQIVFWWYKAVVRLQCSPSCCLYCSKKKEIPAWSRVKRYFGKYKLCVKKASRYLEQCNVRGENGTKISMSSLSALIKKKKNKNP